MYRGSMSPAGVKKGATFAAPVPSLTEEPFHMFTDFLV